MVYKYGFAQRWTLYIVLDTLSPLLDLRSYTWLSFWPPDWHGWAKFDRSFNLGITADHYGHLLYRRTTRTGCYSCLICFLRAFFTWRRWEESGALLLATPGAALYKLCTKCYTGQYESRSNIVDVWCALC